MAEGRTGRFVRNAASVAVAVASAVALGLLIAPVTSGLDAPIAVGNGTAIDVEPLDTSVSVSQASAGQDGASSDAVAARVLGNDVASSHSDGNGSESETTTQIRVPATSGGTVKVAPRTTSASSSPQVSHSSAHSDVLTAHLPGLVEMEVLSSDAEAVWTPASSGSRAEVDGAKVDLLDGDLVIVLLHSERSSNGGGRLYLVRINRAVFLDTADAGAITLDVPDIFTIKIASTSAQGGVFTAEVVETAWENDPEDVSEFADTVESESASPGPADDPADEDDGSNSAPIGAVLPVTGAPVLLIVFTALTLLLVGSVMSSAAQLARTRRRVAAA